jgi:hypothetical protein
MPDGHFFRHFGIFTYDFSTSYIKNNTISAVYGVQGVSLFTASNMDV